MARLAGSDPISEKVISFSMLPNGVDFLSSTMYNGFTENEMNGCSERCDECLVGERPARKNKVVRVYRCFGRDVEIILTKQRWEELDKLQLKQNPR